MCLCMFQPWTASLFQSIMPNNTFTAGSMIVSAIFVIDDLLVLFSAVGLRNLIDDANFRWTDLDTTSVIFCMTFSKT